MSKAGFALVFATALGQGLAMAQGAWGTVKSWTGTATIEATDNRKQSWYSSTMTYKATGNFTISDDASPDGPHILWPMPGADAFSDPKRAAAAFDRWDAHVTGSYEAKGVNESGKPFTVKCSADNRQMTKVSLTIDPMAPKYVVAVTAPEAQFQCSPPAGLRPESRLQQINFELTGDRKAPGPISGTKTFAAGTTTIKVSYSMAPSR